MSYRPSTRLFRHWDFAHQPPGAPFALPQALNVMPDLANAMKYDPDLKVMLNGGYFDLATPFFEGMYEMAHLPMPRKLQANIEYHYYESGHMVYAHDAGAEAAARQRRGVHRQHRAPADRSAAGRPAITRHAPRRGSMAAAIAPARIWLAQPVPACAAPERYILT